MIPKVFDYNKLFIDFTTKVFGVTKKKYGNKPVFFFSKNHLKYFIDIEYINMPSRLFR